MKTVTIEINISDDVAEKLEMANDYPNYDLGCMLTATTRQSFIERFNRNNVLFNIAHGKQGHVINVFNNRGQMV